jgi:hypothetical protein
LTQAYPIPLDAPVMTVAFLLPDIKVSRTKDWSVVRYFLDGVSGRKEAESRQRKKPEPLLVPALVLAGCPEKTF